MATIFEVMELGQIEGMLEYVDILQVGAATCRTLLTALGQSASRPIEARECPPPSRKWLLAAEYSMSGGKLRSHPL